jgi:hypothetical protein
MLTLSTKK